MADRYVQMPDGSYVEWPAGVSAADFKAKTAGKFGLPAADPAATDWLSRAIGQKEQPAIERWLTPTSHTRDQGVLGNVGTAFSNIGAAGLHLLTHPEELVEGAVMASLPVMAARGIESTFKGEKPTLNQIAQRVEGLIGQAGALGLPEAAAEGAGAIRNAAMDEPNVAALKGLRIGPASKKGVSTIRDVEASRPYLKGVKSQADLQARVPEAKSEVWGPYQRTVDAMRDERVNGPDGPTTVGELEGERLQLSADLRTLKKGGPEAEQLAKQKGKSQAELLAREDAVQRALDPVLQRGGIAPAAIRQQFGQLARIGEKVSGRTTIAENEQPFGFGRMANITLAKPKTWLGQPLQGLRDIVAGRPLWSGKPTDVALSEAFRTGGPKPNFGEYRPQLQLPATTITGLPWRGPVITPAPPSFARLPAEAEPGETQPMLRYARPYVEPEPQGIRTPVSAQLHGLPAVASEGEVRPMLGNYRALGETTRVVPSRLERLQTQGEPLPSTPGIRGLLPAPAVPTPSLEPTIAPVFPPGSQFRNIQETPYYPPASQFRTKLPEFDIEEYLRKNP